MLAFVFPGQGSQRRGMGEELFDAVPEFVAAEPEIDATLGYSLRALCLDNPDNRLAQTRYTQPAMYVINALHCYRAMAQGTRPAALAGHSLGEYNALHAAGAFDFLTGLRLVQHRGELMSDIEGGMLAVIGLAQPRILQVLAAQAIDQLDVANLNAPGQIVLAGPRVDIDRAVAPLEAAGARLAQPLPVSAPFHSRYMAGAAARFAAVLATVRFARLTCPVISNVTALPYPTSPDPTATIRDLLVRQITEPVRWTQIVRYLTERAELTLTELGPGNVLTKLEAQITQPPRKRA